MSVVRFFVAKHVEGASSIKKIDVNSAVELAVTIQYDNSPDDDHAEQVGHQGSDSQLFELIAKSSDLIDEMPPATALEFMRDLIIQFRRHFAIEEQIIYRSKYRRTSDHVVQHWKFIQRLSAMTKAYERGNHGIIDEFREYIHEWLSDHISVDDLEFCEFLREHAKR